MAYDSDLGLGALWPERHTHSPRWLSYFLPGLPAPAPLLAGVFRPSQDPRKIPARGSAQEGRAALPVPESTGGWWWESRACAVWVGQARGAGKGGNQGPTGESSPG